MVITMKEAVITSSILILCIAILRRLCSDKISARLQYALWLIVALRLVLPAVDAVFPDILPQADFSVMNAAQKIESSARENINLPKASRQINVNIRKFPFGAAADGPTSVFLAGKAGLFWTDFFKGIWYAGMIVTGVWMAAVNIVFARKLLKGRVKYEQTDYKLKAYFVDGLSSPCLYGFLGRQAVYIPREIEDDEEKLRHILAHEYCHYKHGDVYWSLLRCVLTTIYWFDLFVWLAAVLSKRDCELACDEAAIKILGEGERVSYGRTLLTLITRRTKASDIACGATTMTGSGKSVKERVKRIAGKPRRLAVVLIIALALTAAAGAVTFTSAKESENSVIDIEKEEDVSYIYLPDENIVAKAIPREVSQDYAPTESISAESQEPDDAAFGEWIDALIKKRGAYAGENMVNMSDIAAMLPAPEGFEYKMLEIEGKDGDTNTVTLYYTLVDKTVEETDDAAAFMDAALMFALIGDIEKCNVQMGETLRENITASGAVRSKTLEYDRTDMEELFGSLYPHSENREALIKFYEQVTEYLRSGK